MKCDKKDLLLYAVTGRAWLGGRTLAEQVEEALRGGATFVQLREKELAGEALLAEAREIQALCRRYRVPFVIDDDVALARQIDADGVHVGQSDMEAQKARALLGGDKILGVSAQTVEQAVLAEKNGADYLGVGAVFSTSTKLDACEVPLETLRAICAAVRIPVVAIGGIGAQNVAALAGTGIAGIAVVSALFAARDTRRAAEELSALARKAVDA